MGNCATGSNGHQYEQSQLQKYKSLVHQKQFQLLHLVYDDLAQRIKQRALSIDNFLLFFHKNGEWGDRLFKQFDADSSKYISEEEFIKGIVRIFKTSEDQKIELLFKFFSGENSKKSQGISFKHFLTMLYNYPKQDIKKILNDQDFINKELRHHLRAVDNNKFRGRRLVSINPSDAKNKQIFGMKFRVDDSDSGSASQRIQSKLGHQIIRKLSKQASGNVNQTSFKIRVGQNDVEVKTASIHHLVKKMAKGIFREYKIDQKNGRLKYEYFKDWIRKHKNLYDDYYRSFHNQIWQLDPQTQIPMSSKARIQMKEQMKKVNISLINNVIIVCEQNEHQMPFMLICLQGLIAKPFFEQSNGYGFEISHRDGNYQSKKFYLLNKNLMQRWMQDHLKYFKGTSISQSYQIKQKIGTGKFSVVYKAKQKATNQYFALKVIQAFKLNQQSRNLIAYLFDKCRHESTIMQVFQHPLIVRLKQTIKTKNHIYIVTQLVNGKDLYEFVKDLKYLCQPQAAYIIQQLLIGVRYLHSLGLVHRDLKPENVMIQYNQQKKQIGKIKIIDFGFANHLSKLKTFSQECKILNNQELLAGTPNYIAPQILLKQQFNQKIDNFAIGSILYFALSGNTPFNSHDMAQILSKTVQGAYVLNDKRWKQVSQSAKDLVQKLLQSQSESRISLDDALNHCWFKKFHCVGGAAYSIKQVDIKGITP